MWHSLSCPSTQGTNHGLPNCSTLCRTCEEFCVTGGRHISKNFVTPVRKISDQKTFTAHIFFHPPPFFLHFLTPVFFPISVFLCCCASANFSFNVLYTDNDSCIAIQTYVDQIYFKVLQITLYVILATVYPIVYTVL